MIKLGSFETAVNFIIWSSGVSISLFSLFLVGQEFNRTGYDVHHYEDFKVGWFNRYLDISDFEWGCWTKLTKKLTPWLLVNFFGTIIIRKCKTATAILPYWYTIVSLSATAFVLNSASSLVLLSVVCLFHISLRFKSIFIIWVIAFLCRRYVPAEKLGGSEEEFYLIEVASSWLLLRCISYCMETCTNRRSSFPVLLGYSLYLPTLFCGPLLTFSAFVRNITVPSKEWTLSRAVGVLRSFARCLFWYFFTVMALHFIYVNAIVLRPHIVSRMNGWQLAGLGIAMGHFFHLKYLVFYGVPCCWAAAEGIHTPRPPCCVSRVYLYSVMWRNFDYGLYLFLVRYIYVPVIQCVKSLSRVVSRLLASMVCFLFVYVWHGEGVYVMYWAMLNFSAVTIEAIAREVYSLDPVQSWAEKKISAQNRRRIHCLLAAPLHYFSMLSNYFFIGSLDIGKIFFMRAAIEPFQNNLLILFFLYGAAQTTITIEMREKHQRK